MGREFASIVGSGTIPYTRGILTAEQRGVEANGEGIRIGTQVLVVNPEDLNSVEAFAVSGITVSTTPVEIINPADNPLPRTREVVIQNLGTADVYISHKSTDIPIEGFEITAPGTNDINSVKIPLMHNVSVWAATSAGSASIRMIIY